MRKLAAVLGTVFLLALWAGPASADPPGNNGTIKIDGDDVESVPDNDPHVGCSFTLEWAGYDEGDLTSDVTFELDPPTGPTQTILSDADIPIGEDPAGGATDLDATRAYDLSAPIVATGTPPHPNQGWHVGVTINAEGSIGADVKHKEFWVVGCGYPPSSQPTGLTTASGPTSGDDAAARLTWGMLAAIAAVGALGLSVARRRLAARSGEN